MIRWSDETSASIFNNINLIDADPAFKEARSNIEYLIPGFIKYISGDRTKSKIYGQIKRFYPEELIYMDRNIVEHNTEKLQDIDTLIEDSCALSKNLRVVLIKDKLQLSSISGYEFITFTKGDNHITTLFIEDKEDLTIKFTFSICLKLFDIIITNSLHDNGIPVDKDIINLAYSGNNEIELSKFIVDYLYELVYPFDKSLIIKKEELPSIVSHIYNYNPVIESEYIEELFELVHNTNTGRADNYDYIGFIIKIINHIEDAQAGQLKLPF